MRLAFCFLSNNIENFFYLHGSFHYDLNDVSYSCVSSFTKNVLFNPPIMHINYLEDWNINYKYYRFRTAIDMFQMRQDSFDMARNSDIIYIGDDDMKFRAGSTAVINQCCVYMKDNLDCGAIYLGGNFGGEGDFHKDEIYITNKGHLGTNRGILVRNRKDKLLDNRLHALGANFDAIIGFTCLMQGYYVARRLHVPIEHYTTKIMKKDHHDINYDLGFLRRHGIMSKVNEHIGKWEDHAIWPENIFKLYRNASMRKGWIPKYTPEGDVI
jgi:hypothetical protein